MNKESASADRGEMIKQRRKTRFKKNIEQGFVKLVLLISKQCLKPKISAKVSSIWRYMRLS